MTDTKHNPDTTSTPCPVCREWKRDMDETIAALIQERLVKRELLEALQDTLNMLRAAYMDLGMSFDDNRRVIKAKAAIAKAICRAA